MSAGWIAWLQSHMGFSVQFVHVTWDEVFRLYLWYI